MKKSFPPAERYLLVPLYGSYLKMRYGLKTEDFDKVLPFDGPAIVFANHVHVQDPFMVSACYPYHIRWVAGSYLFRMPLVGTLLHKWVGAIPKTQGRSDLETIRSISKALKNGDIVGLFPEGTRSWDGDMMDIVGGTAKLIRLFKVPVVFLHNQGGFARKPRWAEKDTKGKISLKVAKVLTPEEIASMKLPEIVDVVDKYLSYSHSSYMETHPDAVLKSNHLAEGIERLLYRCPCCGRTGVIESHGTEISCSCGAKGHLNGDYSITSSDFPFTQLPEWRKWEIGKLFTPDEGDRLFPVDRGIMFSVTRDGKEARLSRNFDFTAYPDRFSFDFKDGDVEGEKNKDFFFDHVESVIITAKQTIEFFYDGVQYRVRPYGRISSLKYYDLYNEWLRRKDELGEV